MFFVHRALHLVCLFAVFLVDLVLPGGLLIMENHKKQTEGQEYLFTLRVASN